MRAVRTLRQLMTNEFKGYGSFDSRFKLDNKGFVSYEDYLNSLDDDDFLGHYNWMRDIINNLD